MHGTIAREPIVERVKRRYVNPRAAAEAVFKRTGRPIADNDEAPGTIEWLRKLATKSKGGLSSHVITVTPELAAQIISEFNLDNRPLRRSRVNKYADAMRSGRWKLTSKGLSFSDDGKLNDGQHRLFAVVASGIAVDMMVTFGESRDVFAIIDTGGTRGGSDALHICGYKNTSTLAAAARLLTIVTSERPAANPGLSNDLVIKVVEANPGLEDATGPTSRIMRKTKMSKGAAAVAIFLIRERSAFADRLDFFISKLIDGTGFRSQRDPILILRDGLREGTLKSQNNAPTAAGECAAFILAWNLWAKGRTAQVARLKWDATDAFPIPV